LYHKPKIEAYFDELRTRMAKGNNTIKFDDMLTQFGNPPYGIDGEFGAKWWNNEAVCPPEMAFKGTTIEAIRSAHSVVPYGQIVSQDSIGGKILRCTPDEPDGLSTVELDDGIIKIVEFEGKRCWSAGDDNNRNLYFRIDGDTVYNYNKSVVVSVAFFDSSEGSFEVSYHSNFSGPSAASDEIVLAGTNKWRTEKLTLTYTNFLKTLNGGSDFYVNVKTGKLFIANVAVASSWNAGDIQ
jgi:hypothetical protein